MLRVTTRYIAFCSGNSRHTKVWNVWILVVPIRKNLYEYLCDIPLGAGMSLEKERLLLILQEINKIEIDCTMGSYPIYRSNIYEQFTI